MEMLGFQPKAFPMRKGCSTTELHPLHSLFSFVLHSKLHSLGFWKRFWKTDEIKMEILGFEPKAFPMRKGHSTTELHPLHSLLSFVLQSTLLSLGFWKRFWKRMKKKWRYWDSNVRPSLCERDTLPLNYISYTHFFPLSYNSSCIL